VVTENFLPGGCSPFLVWEVAYDVLNISHNYDPPGIGTECVISFIFVFLLSAAWLVGIRTDSVTAQRN
jgi:hypothetical protein